MYIYIYDSPKRKTCSGPAVVRCDELRCMRTRDFGHTKITEVIIL